MTPWFTHAALDAAGSAERLGLSAAQTHELSDRSVEELVFGPATFEIDAPDGTPFYDADERGHLRDARLLLGVFLIAGGLSLAGLAAVSLRRRDARAATWRIVSGAGLTTAIVVIVVGVVSLVAFDSLFTLFHRVFFPGGNWAFDPSTQRLVQLYPFGFWRIASTALGSLILLLAIGAWALGRWAAGRATPDSTSGATES